MSKNLSRKGLAFGAAVALGSTLFAGAPAFAAGEVVFEASAGTTYKTLLASTFELNASLLGNYPAGNIAQLGYKVINNTNGTVTAIADAPASGTDETLTVTVADGNKTTTGTFASAIGANKITVSTAGSATGTVEVIAFIDSDGQDDLDGTEYQTSRILTFVKPSEVTATTTLTKPTLGDASLVATVALSGDINLAQVDSDEVTVDFSKGGTSITSYPDDNTKSSTNPVPALWNSTDGVLKATFEPDTIDDADYDAYSVTAGTFGAQAKVANVVSGSNVLQTAAAATIDNISVEATGSTDAKNTTKGVRDVSASTTTAGAATVRTGKSATVVATFLQADDKVVANEAVVITATGSGIAADKVTVNGTAVVDSAKTINATTDANGKISVSIVGTDADATDSVTLSFKLQGVTSSNYVVTWNDAAYAVYNLGNLLDAAATVVAGGSLAVEYLVADQWGQGISGDYRLNVTRSGAAGRTTAASWNYTPVLINGKASFTIVDNGAGASSTGDTVAIAVEKAVVGGGFTSQAISANDFDEFVINYAAAAPAASAVTVAATDTTPAVTTTAIAAANLYYQVATAPGHADVTHVYGAVTAADGSAVAGAVVTITAAGLGFQPVVANGTGTATEADKVFTTGSVTVIADASGRYEVLVYSNLSGKKTVSVVSGAATKTIDLTFDAADDNAGTALTLTAVKTIKAGRTLVISGLVVDKFGNPINTVSTSSTTNDEAAELGADLEVTYDGPGLVVGTLPTETDANGKFSIRVLLGSGDSGAAVVTAKYDANGDLDYADTGDLTATSSTLIGASATTVGGVKSVSATVKGAEGLTVKIVRGAKVATAVATSDSYRISLKGIKAGKRDVKIYVNDVLVASKTVTVK